MARITSSSTRLRNLTYSSFLTLFSGTVCAAMAGTVCSDTSGTVYSATSGMVSPIYLAGKGIKIIDKAIEKRFKEANLAVAVFNKKEHSALSALLKKLLLSLTMEE